MSLGSSARRCSNRGFTLLECIAAFAVLGTLIVAAINAQSRLTRTRAEARLRLIASIELDRLLSSGTAEEQGTFEVDGTTLRWQRRTLGREIASQQVDVFEYSVWPDDRAATGEPLVAVEIVTPGQGLPPSSPDLHAPTTEGVPKANADRVLP